MFNKYKNNLNVLDNAENNNNKYVKEAIIKSKNKYLYLVPYTPKLNPIEKNYFNQIKHYLKLNKKIIKYDELKEEIIKAIKNVKKENYQNYFNNTYNKNIYKKRLNIKKKT